MKYTIDMPLKEMDCWGGAAGENLSHLTEEEIDKVEAHLMEEKGEFWEYTWQEVFDLLCDEDWIASVLGFRSWEDFQEWKRKKAKKAKENIEKAEDEKKYFVVTHEWEEYKSNKFGSRENHFTDEIKIRLGYGRPSMDDYLYRCQALISKTFETQNRQKYHQGEDGIITRNNEFSVYCSDGQCGGLSYCADESDFDFEMDQDKVFCKKWRMDLHSDRTGKTHTITGEIDEISELLESIYEELKELRVNE